MYNDGDLEGQISQLEDDTLDLKEDKAIIEVRNIATVESEELPVDFWSMYFDGAVRKEGDGNGFW